MVIGKRVERGELRKKEEGKRRERERERERSD